MADKNPDTQEAKLKSVRRRLNFDDANDNSPTREELDRQFEEERAKHLEEKKAKWNFDFQEERPLPGQWKWEPVSPTSQNTNGAAAPESADASAGQAERDAQDQAP